MSPEGGESQINVGSTITAADLQDQVEILESAIAGTLHYVMGVNTYQPEATPNSELWDGNFLMLRFEVEDAAEYTLTITHNNSESYAPIVLTEASDPDDFVVLFRIVDTDTESITAVLEVNGEVVETRVFDDFTDMILETPISFTLGLVPPEGTDVVLSKTVSDLQSTISIAESQEALMDYDLAGSLAYVEEFTEYSTEVEEQEGTFLVLDTSILPEGSTLQLMTNINNVVAAAGKVVQNRYMVLRITEDINAIIARVSKAKQYKLWAMTPDSLVLGTKA